MLTERTAEGEHSPKRKWVVSDMIISKIGIIQYIYYCILIILQYSLNNSTPARKGL